MVDNFEIKCEKCGNVAVDVRGTAVQFGTKVRVKFVCLTCGSTSQVPVTQISLEDFYDLPDNEDLP